MIDSLPASFVDSWRNEIAISYDPIPQKTGNFYAENACHHRLRLKVTIVLILLC